MKKILTTIFIFLISITIVHAEKITVKFDECVDGDTAWFDIDGTKTKFRFLAIDTPETVHPTKAVQEFGKEASNYTCNAITNASKIEIEYDSKSNKTDKYGRNLAWIWVDDVLLQEKLVSLGYASVSYIYGEYNYLPSLCKVQKEAIDSKVGIWTEEGREEGYCSKVDYSNASSISDLTKLNVTASSDDTTTTIKESTTNTKYLSLALVVLVCVLSGSGVISRKRVKRIIKKIS